MTSPTGRRIAVLGAGVMGTGIAAMATGYGMPVVLVDVDQRALERARDGVDRQLRQARLLGALPHDSALGTLTTTTAIADMTGSTGVIEAVTEDLAIKSTALVDATNQVCPGTPLISNTSGIPIAEIASSVPRPEDLIGVHFMNPPLLITLVEVARGPLTSDPTLDAVTSLLGIWGRRAVTVSDAPGFVTSRLLHPMINSAVRLVEEGIASVEAVDTLMQGCLGHRLGPLRTADLIGLDNLVDSLTALQQRTGDEACRPCSLLLQKVRERQLGRKSGRGFYDYEGALS